MSERGKAALTNLRLANSGDGPSTMRSRLKSGRNQVAFHYGREAFADAPMFSKIFANKDRPAESLILYEKDSRAYFYYAEQVRENVTYDFNDKEGDAQIKVKLGKFLSDSRALMQQMGQFLDELLSAYS